MDPAAAAIVGSIVGAASIASVAGVTLVVRNTIVSKTKMSEGSVMSPNSSSCPDEVSGNTGSVSKKKMLEGSVMSLDSSSCSDERTFVSLKFLFTKSIPGHGEIFEEVFRGNLQPGDILLFPLDRSNSVIAQALFRHAAVYCGDGEVIHFQGTESQQSPGVIIKEGSVKMKKERGNFRVYRKKDGVVLEEFSRRVRRAMNSEAKYDPRTNNCIHFALSLLGLQKFSSQLVQIQDEGDNSCSETVTSSPPSPAGQGSSHTA